MRIIAADASSTDAESKRAAPKVALQASLFHTSARSWNQRPGEPNTIQVDLKTHSIFFTPLPQKQPYLPSPAHLQLGSYSRLVRTYLAALSKNYLILVVVNHWR